MPMIDVYATAGTFTDPGSLAQRLAATLMQIEEVPALPMFRNNTATFIHALPNEAIANVEGETNAELVAAVRAEAAKLARGTDG